jgi:hypothetical protein
MAQVIRNPFSQIFLDIVILSNTAEALQSEEWLVPTVSTYLFFHYSCLLHMYTVERRLETALQIFTV